MSRRFLVGLTTVPLAASGLGVVATISSAHAADCYFPAWSDVDGRTGHGILGSTPIRVGPEGTCGPETYVGDYVKLAYDCWRFNKEGRTWTHVHLAGSRGIDDGWVRDDFLNNDGAIVKCPN